KRVRFFQSGRQVLLKKLPWERHVYSRARSRVQPISIGAAWRCPTPYSPSDSSAATQTYSAKCAISLTPCFSKVINDRHEFSTVSTVSFLCSSARFCHLPFAIFYSR